jgi:Protein of unknown function (DUF4231)
MPSDDVAGPHRQTAIDKQLSDAQQNLADMRRRRKIIRAIFVVCGFIEVGLIIAAFLWEPGHGRAAWIIAAILWPFSVPLTFHIVFGADFGDEGQSPATKEALIAAVTLVDRLRVQRHELLVGKSGGKLASYVRYRESIPELIARYRIRANRYKKINNALQVFIIMGSLFVSVATGLFGASKKARLIIVGVSLGVAISSSLVAYFKIRERGSQLQKTADLIEIEFRAVELGIGQYAELDPEDALRRFVETVETIRSEHTTRQRQLDQGADLHYIDQSSIVDERLAT